MGWMTSIKYIKYTLALYSRPFKLLTFKSWPTLFVPAVINL